jgi:hypothetical protein
LKKPVTKTISELYILVETILCEVLIMSKKITVLLMSIILALSFAGNALAAKSEPELNASYDVGLRFTYISYTNTSISINSSGKASCTAKISASSNVDRVYISGYLQRYDNGWTTVKHWTKTSYSSSCNLLSSHYVTSGYQYRYIVYYYAYDGSNSESTSGSHTASY